MDEVQELVVSGNRASLAVKLGLEPRKGWLSQDWYLLFPTLADKKAFIQLCEEEEIY